jgi:hypothetical protein
MGFPSFHSGRMLRTVATASACGLLSAAAAVATPSEPTGTDPAYQALGSRSGVPTSKACLVRSGRHDTLVHLVPICTL